MRCIVMRASEWKWRGVNSPRGISGHSPAYNTTEIIGALTRRYGRLETIAVKVTPKGSTEVLHDHAGLTDLTVMSGHGWLEEEDEFAEIYPGDRIIIPPDSFHRTTTRDGRLMILIGTYMSGEGDRQHIVRKKPPEGQ